MTHLSTGLLDASRELLGVVQRYGSVSEAIHKQLRTVVVIDTARVVDLALKCGWLAANQGGQLILSPAGRALHEAGETEEARRVQLRDVLLRERPTWTALIGRGRRETLPHISADTKDALKRAGLLRDMGDPAILGWWDTLSNAVRGDRASRQLEIGRDGERLTRLFELERVGVEPPWEGAESNLKGYDFISRVSKEDGARYLIEVKTSTQSVAQASFFVSRNEWRVALDSPRYVFHLWCLEKKTPLLAVIQRDEVAAHIAKNKGMGEWDSVETPMRAFAQRFEAWTPS